MQYYTKQQIAGGTRYFGKTLVGNWNEEYEQKDNLVQGILLGEMNGTLRLSKFTRKLETLGAGVRLPGGGAGGMVELGEPVEIVALQNGNRCLPPGCLRPPHCRPPFHPSCRGVPSGSRSTWTRRTPTAAS